MFTTGCLCLREVPQADDGFDLGPAHAVYFATYEAVKHVMGGNRAGVHHPLAAATSGACATIASDALMNPFDGTPIPAVYPAVIYR